MASRGLDLGDVGFSLTAETSGLERSRQKLIEFGNEVNKWEKRTDDASQRVAAAYMKQERALVNMYQKFTQLRTQMKGAGVPAESLGKVTESIKLLTDTLTAANKAGRPLERSLLDMQRAGYATTSEFTRLRGVLTDWQNQQKNSTQQQLRYHKQVAVERATAEKEAAQQQLRYHRMVSVERTQAEREALVQQLRYHRQVAAERAENEKEQRENSRRLHRVAVAERNEQEKAALYQQNLNHKVAVLERLQREKDAAQQQIRYHRLVAAERKESLLDQRRTQQLSFGTQTAGIRAQTQASNLIGNATRAFVPDSISAGYSSALSAFQEKLRSSVKSSHDLRLAQVELSRSFAEVTQRVKDYVASQNAANQAEQLVSRAAGRVRRINEVAVGFNAPEKYVTANKNNLQAYQAAVFSGDRATADVALKKLNTGILQTQQVISSATDRAQKFAGAVRNMERASILAVGPLSGVGARLAVLSALLESVSAQAALTIAGVTGVTVGVTMLTTAGVRATMEMEKWVGMLTAASGAQSFVARDLEWLTKTADQYGQSIKVIVPSYAQFATSARLANVSLRDQRDIFESVLMAGTSLRWNTDQVGRAFLALEQMMSKGQIQAQEIKLQLGQVLPGAFEIMAMAAGKSQKEFLKMMEQGEAYTKDLLPKFAEKLREIYAEAAKLGAISIQSDIGRYETAMFNFTKAFDDTVKTSQAFHAALKAVNGILETFTRNIDSVLAGIASFASFVAVMAAPTVVGGLVKIASTIKNITLATIGLNAALTATPVGFMLRLAAAVGVAVMGYNILTRTRNADIEASKEVISQSASEIATLQRSAQVNADLWAQKTQMLVQHLQTQLSAYKIYSGAIAELENKMRKEMSGTISGMWYRMKESFKALTGQETNEGLLARWKTEQSDRQNIIGSTIKQLDALGKMHVKVQGIEKGGSAADKNKKFAGQLETALDNVRALATELTTLQEKKRALDAGNPEGLKYFEALKDATNFVEKLKDARLEGSIYKKMTPTFKELGVLGSNLTETLTNLNLRIAQEKEKVEESNRVWEEKKRLLRELPEYYAKVSEAQQIWNERLGEANAAFAKGEEGLDQYKKEKTRLKEIAQLWSTVTANKAAPTEEVFAAWHRLLGLVYKTYAAEDQLEIDKKYKEITNLLGDQEDALEEINRTYMRRAQIVQMSSATEETKIRNLSQLYKMYQKEVWAAGSELQNTLTELVQQWATNFGNTIAEMTKTGKASFKDFAQSVLTDLIDLQSKVLANRIFESLFGNYATGGTSGGVGMFGGLLQSLTSWMMPQQSTPYNALAMAFSSTPFNQLNAATGLSGITGFATGGSFTVAGSGGTDSQLVQFMATPGEKVTVKTPDQDNGSGGNIVIQGPLMVVHATDAQSFNRSQGQITASLASALQYARRNL